MSAISEIAVLLRNGKSVRQSPDAGGLPITRIETIADGTINPVKVGFADLGESDCTDWLLQDGDILISHINSTKHLGKCAIYQGSPPALVHGMNLLSLRVDEQTAAPRYIYRMLSSPDFRRQLPRITKDSVNQSSFNISNFKKLNIPLPPLAEQKQITEILDAADALRSKRRESLAQLDTLLQSIFLDMFGDPVTNPMGWGDNVVLGEVADIVGGLTKGRKLKDQVTREVPYLAVVNVQDRHIVLEPLKRIRATDSEIQRYSLKNNDLLMTEGGDPDKLGRGTLWHEEVKECIHQNHVFRVRLHDDRLKPIFLNWLVGSQRGKRYFLRQAKQTTGIATINLTQLRKFPLLMPPLELQHRFASIVESVEKQKASERAHLTELETLFASLQSRAFRGDL